MSALYENILKITIPNYLGLSGLPQFVQYLISDFSLGSS